MQQLRKDSIFLTIEGGFRQLLIWRVPWASSLFAAKPSESPTRDEGTNGCLSWFLYVTHVSTVMVCPHLWLKRIGNNDQQRQSTNPRQSCHPAKNYNVQNIHQSPRASTPHTRYPAESILWNRISGRSWASEKWQNCESVALVAARQ